MMDNAKQQCQNVADFRYTWPGRDESYICFEHSTWLMTIVSAMGLYLQLIPIVTNEKCRQHKAVTVEGEKK